MEEKYYFIDETTITEICNSLRIVLGVSDKFQITEIAEKILSISTVEEV